MVLIGTSGWSYPHWRDVFYPSEVKSRDWLAYYCEHLSTVEVNSTFYHLPQVKTVQNWAEKTPSHFSFAIKGSRYITHRLKLRDCQEPVENFLRRIAPLRQKTAAILWQIPPSLLRDDSLIEGFFSLLPSDFRHVLEVRHQSWLDDQVFNLCRKTGVCFCSISLPEFPPVAVAATDFAYLRMHGSTALYSSDYSEQELQEWAERIRQLAKKSDRIFVYFNNDVGGYAIRNAIRLRQILREGGEKAG